MNNPQQENSLTSSVRKLAWCGLVLSFLFWLVSPGIPPTWLNWGRVEALLAMAFLWNVSRLRNWARRGCFILWAAEWPIIILHIAVFVKAAANGGAPLARPGAGLYEAAWAAHYLFDFFFFSYLLVPRVRTVFIQSRVRKGMRVLFFLSLIALGSASIFLGSSATIEKPQNGQPGSASLSLHFPDFALSMINRIIGVISKNPK